MVIVEQLAAMPLLRGVDEGLLQGLATHAEERHVEPGDAVVRQHEEARHAFFLLSGAVTLRISVAGSGDLLVGRTSQPGALIGWSVFCPPYRYTTTTLSEQAGVLIRISRLGFDTLMSRDPRCGGELLRRVAECVAERMEQARDRLIEAAEPCGSLGPTGDRDSEPKSRIDPSTPPGRKRLLLCSRLFASIQDRDLDHLAAAARVEHIASGDRPAVEGAEGHGISIVASGRLTLSARSGEREIPIRTLHEPGNTFGWSSVVSPHRCRAGVVADAPSELVVLDRTLLDSLAGRRPQFGLDFGRAIIRLLGDRLTEVRSSLVARRYEEEVVAIRALLDQHAEELSVSSPLLKVPHLLDHRLTVSDAFDVLDRLVLDGDATQKTIAEVCLDLLEHVRAELGFYGELQCIYDGVARSPAGTPAETLRRWSSDGFARLFSRVQHVIRGTEHLPDEPGHIFIVNHLRSHPGNALPNDFHLILDTNFVSSMILEPKYGEAPIRVVRREYPSEFMQKQYYDRLGFIMVGARGTTGYEESSRQNRWDELHALASRHLGAKRNLLICPEGEPTVTEKSPLRFRSGTFRLAAGIDPEPLIVPIAVAHFDKKIVRTVVAAVVHEPFRVSAVVNDPTNELELAAFIGNLRDRFRGWVRQAAALADVPL